MVQGARVARVGLLAALLLGPHSAAAGAVELTKANFENEVFGGKNAFVKYLAPWCGHCKSMKPAWDQLGDAWKDSTSVVVADVDCTADGGKDVCQKQGVSGYPTIKYYTAETGQEGKDYSGGRSFDELNSFVETELAEECDVKTKQSCTEKEAGYVDKQREKGAEKWEAEAKRLEGMLGQDMSDEKKKWLNQRINILEQLLGKKVRKKKASSGNFPWYMKILGAVALSSIFVGLLAIVLCRPSKKAKAPAAEAEKSAEPEGDKKED